MVLPAAWRIFGRLKAGEADGTRIQCAPQMHWAWRRADRMVIGDQLFTDVLGAKRLGICPPLSCGRYKGRAYATVYA